MTTRALQTGLAQAAEKVGGRQLDLFLSVTRERRDESAG